ncbi:response regulator transcription factor [Microbacterium sp. A588]
MDGAALQTGEKTIDALESGRRAPATYRLDGPERFVIIPAGSASESIDHVVAWTRGSAAAASAVVVWLDPRSQAEGTTARAGALWVRMITLLHSHGHIDDDRLHRDLMAASASGDSALGTLARIIQDLDRAVVVVFHGEGAAPAFAAQVESDVADLLAQTTKLRVIVVKEVAPSLAEPLESSKAAPRCVDLAMQRFIRDTGAAPYLDAQLARALTGHDDAALQLDRLVQKGLGTWHATSDGKPEFYYVDGVYEEAQANATGFSRSRTEQGTAAVIARWFLTERFDPSAALPFAVRSGDIDLIAAVGMRLFPLGGDDGDVYADMIRRIPRSEQLAHPILALWMGTQLALQPDGMDRAMVYLRAAGDRAAATARSLPPTERAILDGVEAYVLRRSGQVSAGRAKARIASRDLAKLALNRKLDPSLNQVLVTVWHQVGVSLVYAGARSEAVELYRLLFDYCDEHALGHRRNSSASMLAFIAADNGSVREAERWLELVIEEDWPSAWRTGYTRTYRDLAEILIAVNQVDAMRLDGVLSRFIAFESETEHWDIVVFAQVCAALIRGDVSAASTWFDERVGERLDGTTHPVIRERLRLLRLMLRAAGADPHQEITGRRTVAARATHAALSAIIAARTADADRAVADAVTAGLSARTPLEQGFAIIASLLVARHSAHSVDLVTARTKLHMLAEIHGLRFPLIYLSASDRQALLAGSGAGTESPHPLQPVLRAVPTCVQSDGMETRRALLTRQEIAVLRALCAHSSRQDIAEQLHLSVNTVKVHLGSVYRKLGVHSRAEALVAASLLGVLPKER